MPLEHVTILKKRSCLIIKMKFLHLIMRAHQRASHNPDTSSIDGTTWFESSNNDVSKIHNHKNLGENNKTFEVCPWIVTDKLRLNSWPTSKDILTDKLLVWLITSGNASWIKPKLNMTNTNFFLESYWALLEPNIECMLIN